MRILHFIPTTEDSADLATAYLSTLVGVMQQSAEVLVIHADGSSLSENKKQASAFAPQIVHIHTCWEMRSAQMAKWAHSANIPVVLSPHGTLEPWIVERKYLHEKLPKLLLYQHETICNADAIVVNGEMELRTMQTLSWNAARKSRRPWNDRLCLVRNAIITNDISPEQMTHEMMQLYRKVLDSNAWMLMPPDDRQAADGLLRAGLAPTPEHSTVTPEQRSAIGRLDQESWRRILIHADEEDILPIIQRGATAISSQSGDGLSHYPRDLNPQALDRFPPRRPKARGPLDSQQTLWPQMKHRIKELNTYYGDCREYHFCVMAANLSYETRNGTLSRRHLAEIYQQLRYEDYDEDLLARMLREAELYDFTQQLQQTLSQMLGLTEGFMI